MQMSKLKFVRRWFQILRCGHFWYILQINFYERPLSPEIFFCKNTRPENTKNCCSFRNVQISEFQNQFQTNSSLHISIFLVQMGESFWQKNSLITHILFELCLFRCLAQPTYFRDTLYLKITFHLKKSCSKII